MTTGSQYRSNDWLNDPLAGLVVPFVPPSVPWQNVPFLTGITVLVGSGSNALAAVPTTSLPTGYRVEIAIGGFDQQWALTAGTVDTGDGTLRPNDYNVSTNQRYWLQYE